MNDIKDIKKLLKYYFGETLDFKISKKFYLIVSRKKSCYSAGFWFDVHNGKIWIFCDLTFKDDGMDAYFLPILATDKCAENTIRSFIEKSLFLNFSPRDLNKNFDGWC